MNWLPYLWVSVATACVTLGLLHTFTWVRRPNRWAHLCFAFCAASAAVLAAAELAIVQAQSVDEIRDAFRVGVVAAHLLVIGSLVYIRVSLQAGRTWLLCLLVGLRLAVLIPSIVLPGGLYYTEIVEIRTIVFLGHSLNVPVGPVHPYSWVVALTTLLCLVFVMDVIIQCWRTPARWLALLTCGSFSLLLVAGAVQAQLVIRGLANLPFIVSWWMSPVVLAIGYDLARRAMLFETLSAELAISRSRLARSESEFRDMVEHVPNAMLLVDDRDVIVYANPPVNRIFGYTNGDVRGEDVRTLIPAFSHDSDTGAPGDMPPACPGQKVPASVEVVGRRRDGADLPMELSVHSMTLSTGRFRLVTAIDHTAERAAEQEAALRRSELTHLSRVTLLGELAGSLAHELNQPLSAILSNTEAASRLLSDEICDDNEVRAILDDVVAAGVRAGEVIYRLRKLLHKGELDKQPTDVNDAIVEILKLMRADLLHRNVSIDTDLESGLPEVIADRVQIQQVMMNLVANGCDAMSGMPPSKRKLMVSSRRHRSEMIAISVRDWGNGIEPDLLETIFAPFYTTKPNGMGLGLAVCKTIVSAHQGQLWAENVSSGGACVTVTIPVKQEGKRNGYAKAQSLYR